MITTATIQTEAQERYKTGLADWLLMAILVDVWKAEGEKGSELSTDELYEIMDKHVDKLIKGDQV